MQFVWIIPCLPAAAAAMSWFAGADPASRRRAGIVTSVSLLLSAIAAAALTAWLLQRPLGARVIDRIVASWVPGLPLQLRDGRYAPFQVDWSIHLDMWSAALLVVTAVAGALIQARLLRHPAAADVVRPISAFLACLLFLVMAGGSVTMLSGWTFLGLSSHWLTRRQTAGESTPQREVWGAAVLAAGGASVVVAVVLAAAVFGTTELAALNTAVRALPPASPRSGGVTAICALIAGGAVASASQVPLQAWQKMQRRGAAGLWLQAGAMVAAGAYLMVQTAPLFQHVLGR